METQKDISRHLIRMGEPESQLLEIESTIKVIWHHAFLRHNLDTMSLTRAVRVGVRAVNMLLPGPAIVSHGGLEGRLQRGCST
jgi:hypothetical protein